MAQPVLLVEMSSFEHDFVAALAGSPDAIPLTAPPYLNAWFDENEKVLEFALTHAKGRILREGPICYAYLLFLRFCTVGH